ncbi:MAG: D-glycero-beta-D-manno-heptose 1-phosphate adenylyltransferase [Candidatus Omnitrophota bacterium]
MRLIQKKIKTAGALKKIIPGLKKQGKTIAFTNGCFDILHSGHVSYLQEAKKLADVLIVAVNSDGSVKRIKGRGRPVIKLKDRMWAVAALESVDFVTYFEQDTPLKIIKLLKPDILFKGKDWSKNKIVGKEVVESYGGRIMTLPYIKGQSSSKIINRIEKTF